MQTRSKKAAHEASKQLLYQVNKSHSQLTKENEEPIHRSRSTTPKSVTQRRLRSQAKKELAKSVERDLSPVKGSLFLGSRSIHEDKELLKVGKKNPAVLAYLNGKLQEQVIRQGKEVRKTVLNEDVLLFTKAVLNETNLKNSDNGHISQEKNDFVKPLPKPRLQALESSSPSKMPQTTSVPCFGQPTALNGIKGCINVHNNQAKIDFDKAFPRPKPKPLDPVLPNQLNEQGLSPCFGQKKNAKHVLEEANRKYRVSEKKGSRRLKSKRSNVWCFRLLIINLALLTFTLWPLLFSDGEQVKGIASTGEIEIEKDPGAPLSEQDRLESLNLEFQKLNQELEAYITNIENPKESFYNFKNLLPLSIISIGLQLLAWMVFVSSKSS